MFVDYNTLSKSLSLFTNYPKSEQNGEIVNVVRHHRTDIKCYLFQNVIVYYLHASNKSYLF